MTQDGSLALSKYWRLKLWARVQASDFLTVNEKRAAVGYSAVEGGDVMAPAPPL